MRLPSGSLHDEGCGSPWFVPQGLSDGHVRGLIREEELLDLVRAGQRDGGGEQALPLANVFDEEMLIHGTQRKPGVVAAHLPVERRIAIDEVDGEAEFRGEEVGGCFEVANVEVRGDGGENRLSVLVRWGRRQWIRGRWLCGRGSPGWPARRGSRGAVRRSGRGRRCRRWCAPGDGGRGKG